MIFRLDKRELWNPNCVFYLHFLFFLFSIARITVVCGCYTTRCDASLFPPPIGYIVRCLLVVFSFLGQVSFPFGDCQQLPELQIQSPRRRFDHAHFKEVAKVVTRNLNKVSRSAGSFRDCAFQQFGIFIIETVPKSYRNFWQHSHAY